MPQDGTIDYVEFPAHSLPAVKDFYSTAFGWSFVDYGPTYAAFERSAGLDGGFDASQEPSAVTKPLVVLFAKDLEAMEAKVRAAGGVVTIPPYSFPGGRRFHFRDPAGNVLAVWSDT